VAKFRGSTHAIVQDAFPKHEWLPWRFVQTPRKWWNVKTNQLQFIEWLRKQLGMAALEELYTLTTFDIIQHHGTQGLSFALQVRA